MKTTKKRTFSTDYFLEDLYKRTKSFVQLHLNSKKVVPKHTTVFNRFEEIH